MSIVPERQLFIGIGLIAVYGALGGMVLGGPFMGCGLLAGPILALPLGIPFALVCVRWHLSALLVASSQAAGAIALGLIGIHFLVPADSSWAWLGQLLGGTLGVVVAFRTREAEITPGTCTECGYNLTGNVSGVCPECGAEVPEDLVQREKDGGQDSKASQRDEQAEPES